MTGLLFRFAFRTVQAWTQGQIAEAFDLRCNEAAARRVADAKAVALPQGFFADKSLEKRIENLMTHKLTPSRRARWTALASLAAALFLTCFGSFQLAAQAQDETIYSVRDAGVSAPKLLSKTEPQYTPEAREKKISGTVVLSIVISSSGQISDAKVLSSLEETLDQNAIAAVKTWSFSPATKEGRPVACKATVEVNFRRS